MSNFTSIFFLLAPIRVCNLFSPPPLPLPTFLLSGMQYIFFFKKKGSIPVHMYEYTNTWIDSFFVHALDLAITKKALLYFFWNWCLRTKTLEHTWLLRERQDIVLMKKTLQKKKSFSFTKRLGGCLSDIAYILVYKIFFGWPKKDSRLNEFNWQ